MVFLFFFFFFERDRRFHAKRFSRLEELVSREKRITQQRPPLCNFDLYVKASPRKEFAIFVHGNLLRPLFIRQLVTVDEIFSGRIFIYRFSISHKLSKEDRREDRQVSLDRRFIIRFRSDCTTIMRKVNKDTLEHTLDERKSAVIYVPFPST